MARLSSDVVSGKQGWVHGHKTHAPRFVNRMSASARLLVHVDPEHAWFSCCSRSAIVCDADPHAMYEAHVASDVNLALL